jgi:hypothetical protein
MATLPHVSHAALQQDYVDFGTTGSIQKFPGRKVVDPENVINNVIDPENVVPASALQSRVAVKAAAGCRAQATAGGAASRGCRPR